MLARHFCQTINLSTFLPTFPRIYFTQGWRQKPYVISSTYHFCSDDSTIGEDSIRKLRHSLYSGPYSRYTMSNTTPTVRARRMPDNPRFYACGMKHMRVCRIAGQADYRISDRNIIEADATVPARGRYRRG